MEEYFVLVVYILLVVAVVSVFVLLGVRFDRKQQQKAVEGIQDEVCWLQNNYLGIIVN